MATAPSALGIDVSRWQLNVDWPAVKAAGISFAFAKATEATNVVDPTFATNWAGMKAAGLLRGAYHFFRPGVDPKAQAAWFVKAVKEPGEMPLVLDVESDGGMDSLSLAKNILACLLEIERLARVRPIVYTGPGFWNSRVAIPAAPPWTGDHTLWIAQYTSALQPIVPRGWKAWTIWQYSGSGTISGIKGNVDRNKFAGTEDDLRQWAQNAAKPAAAVSVQPAPAAAPPAASTGVPLNAPTPAAPPAPPALNAPMPAPPRPRTGTLE